MTARRALYLGALVLALCFGMDLMTAGPGAFAFDRPSLFVDGRALERPASAESDMLRDDMRLAESAPVVLVLPTRAPAPRAGTSPARAPVRLVLKIPTDPPSISDH